MPDTQNAPEALWTRADSKAVAVLTALPIFLFVAAVAAGYPLITGDDVTQNYPLEYLSGQILRHGHLPLYDAFLWSGTPLLGGTVAHALAPMTLLFAVVQPLAAWVIGEAAVLAAAAVGCQLFLRRTGCGPVAAALGGAWFGLGGFVSSQVVHIDFVAAAAALPWLLVGLDGLATRRASARRRHCVLVASAIAWICLCGSPDIVIDTALVCGAYVGHLLLQPLEPERRAIRRLRLFAWAIGGAGGGVAIGALQWMPSVAFLAASQRAHPNLAFISGGSLDWANFLELLVPHVLGGGSLGSRAFGGTYPLAEVDAYPGVVALVALFALLVSWHHAGAWRWRVWLAVCAVALLLVSGGHTPLERALALLPIVGDQRLPSRALISFALATSLLGGYFVNSLLATHPTRRQVAAGLVPIAGILGVVLATVVTGKPAGGALVAHAHTGWSLAGVIPDLLLATLLAAAAAALLLFGRRLKGRRRALVAAALVVLDLASFDANQSSFAPEYASALSVVDRAEVAALAGSGRFIVVDPHLVAGLALDHVGAADLGAVADLPDAGGYGSLTWGPYASATGTHVQDGASAAAVADGTLSSLGVHVLLTVSSELVSNAPSSKSTLRVGNRAASVRWFGTPVTVGSISFTTTSYTTRAWLLRLASSLRLLDSGGGLVAAAAVTTVRATHAEGGRVNVRYVPPTSAIGFELGRAGMKTPFAVREPLVLPRNGAAFSTDGPLAAALSAGGWVEVGGLAGFSVLVDKGASPLYRVTGTGGRTRVISNDPWTGAASVQVSTPRTALLVRSVADVPGWRATIVHDAADSRAPVRRDGLIQSVAVPAGVSTVTFFYVAPGWAAGQLLALGGTVGCAGLLLLPPCLEAVRRRRRHHWAR